MKRLPWITALLLMSASTAALAAPDSCERVKATFSRKSSTTACRNLALR